MRLSKENLLLGVLCLVCTAVAVNQWRLGASTWLEAFAVLVSALTVWLEVIEHIGNWPLGVVGGIAYAIIYQQQNLFANAWLSLFYIPLGVYGWFAWKRGKGHREELPISHVTVRMVGVLILLTAIGTFAVWKILVNAKDENPWLDSFTTVASLVGEFMLARKWIENWHLWIVVNILSIYLFYTANLKPTAGLYLVFLVMAVIGLVGWMKLLRAQEALAPL